MGKYIALKKPAAPKSTSPNQPTKERKKGKQKLTDPWKIRKTLQTSFSFIFITRNSQKPGLECLRRAQSLNSVFLVLIKFSNKQEKSCRILLLIIHSQ